MHYCLCMYMHCDTFLRHQISHLKAPQDISLIEGVLVRQLFIDKKL